MEGSGQGSGQRIWYFLYLFVVFELAKTDMKGIYYKEGVEVYKECIRVGAGQWPEGATTRRVAATHDALLFAQREVSSFAICTKHSFAQCTKLFVTRGAFLFAQ